MSVPKVSWVYTQWKGRLYKIASTYDKYDIPADVTREKGSEKEGRRQKPACATLSIEAANAFVLCASSRAKGVPLMTSTLRGEGVLDKLPE